MNKSEKKDWAKLIYLKENWTQKEIAAKVKVSETTLSHWAKKENWAHLKTSLVITKEEQLRRIYEQIAALNDAIVISEQKYATASQADTMNKLAAAARTMETEVALADVIEVGSRFINFLRPIDIEKTKEFTLLFDAFIRESAKRS
jgi:DNA-binding transcriptional regulator LsrR (DeoR family)